MARYDRIAPLASPTRTNSFPCWLVLRDIEGNDRDIELARRARLRFLALRPVRRLLDRGIAHVSNDSHRAQIQAVREELGYLPARDIERARLARFLYNIEDKDLPRMFAATHEMAETCAAAGQLYGAEEYALTALDLANAHGSIRHQCAAHIRLAHVERVRGRWKEASDWADKAVVLAKTGGDLFDLIRALSEQAAVAAASGDGVRTHNIMAEAVHHARASHDAQAEKLAEARLCACELLLGNPDAALEHGWIALRQLDDVRERAALLENVATAFALLGYHKAADRCFTMVAQRGVDTALRARARAGQAAQAAAGGYGDLFRERRDAIMHDAAEWSTDPRVCAFVHVELGRACVIVDDVDFARDHLRDAITIARRHSLFDLLTRAEEVLTALEENSPHRLIAAVRVGSAGAVVQRIAEQLEALPDLPVINH